ncbi:hypothetical protein [Pseudanabaena sp. 'Roaring Creek']|uniref:hypothetical protein n=1 Tax=Pseudanabaena sp. 'Roaring Creek' TaxID=1681830 RepID=UPI0006D7F995|nr:hypothetical protein [Pseudanabaena sp. 'Roaring Creek']
MRNYIILFLVSLVLSIILTGQNHLQDIANPEISIIKTVPVQAETKTTSCSSIPTETENTPSFEGKTFVQKIASSGNIIAEYSYLESNFLESKTSNFQTINQQKFKIYRNNELVFTKKILSDNSNNNLKNTYNSKYLSEYKNNLSFFLHKYYDVTDIDNDGELEVVVSDGKSLLIYKYNQKYNCYQGKIDHSFFSSLFLHSLEKANYQFKQTSSLDNIKAVTSFRSVYLFNSPISNINLQIFKDDRLITDTAIDNDRLQFRISLTLKILALEKESLPEVIFQSFTRGNKCCSIYLIYYYDPNSGKFISNESEWFFVDRPYLKDLDNDENIEFVSWDKRFAGSVKPLQIFHFHNGEFVDVTRLFQTEIRKDMEGIWEIVDTTHDPYSLKSALSAYLADKYMLGEGNEGWEQVEKTYQESDREEFFASLEKSLYMRGYIH